MRTLPNQAAPPQGPASTTGSATATFDFAIPRSTLVLLEVFTAGVTSTLSKCAGSSLYVITNDASGNVSYSGGAATNLLTAIDLALTGVTVAPSIPAGKADVIRLTATGVAGQTINWAASAFFRVALDTNP